jgi:ATP-dependent DNA helicase RecQ
MAVTGRVDWNVKTLTLMARAGLIEFAADPHLMNGDSSGSKHRRVIRILDETHLDTKTWELKVDPAREKTKAFSAFGYRLMRELLSSERCTSDIFADVYRIPQRGSTEPFGLRVIPSPACGGCTFCRRQRQEPHQSPLPTPRPVWPNPPNQIGQGLGRFLYQGHALVITYEQEAVDVLWIPKLTRLMGWFVRQGIQNLVAPRDLLDEFWSEWASLQRPTVFFSETFESIFLPRVPTAVVVGRDGTPRIRPQKAERPLIVLIPRWLENPHHPGCALADSFSGPRISLSEFQQRVGL